MKLPARSSAKAPRSEIEGSCLLMSMALRAFCKAIEPVSSPHFLSKSSMALRKHKLAGHNSIE